MSLTVKISRFGVKILTLKSISEYGSLPALTHALVHVVDMSEKGPISPDKRHFCNTQIRTYTFTIYGNNVHHLVDIRAE